MEVQLRRCFQCMQFFIKRTSSDSRATVVIIILWYERNRVHTWRSSSCDYTSKVGPRPGMHPRDTVEARQNRAHFATDISIHR